MTYSSSLTDQEWEILEPLLAVKKLTCPAKWSKREILDGVFYRNKNGCTWGDLPKDLPPYRAVYWHYKQWRAEGVLDTIMAHLHGRVREAAKKTHWTTLIIVDSQALKNACNARLASKGFCHDKATNGIKRH